MNLEDSESEFFSDKNRIQIIESQRARKKYVVRKRNEYMRYSKKRFSQEISSIIADFAAPENPPSVWVWLGIYNHMKVQGIFRSTEWKQDNYVQNL